MSQFIQRDYIAPFVASHTNKVALKNIYKKMQPTHYVNGEEVFDREIFFRGRSFSSTGANGIRNDKLFNKFITKLGLRRKTLEENNYSGTTDVYFYLDDRKVSFSPQSVSTISDTLNYDYMSKILNSDKQSVYPNYYYECDKKVNDTIAILPFNTSTQTRVVFIVNGMESSISEDGYFKIINNNVITFTDAAIEDEVNMFSYGVNTRSLAVKTVYKDNTYVVDYVSLTSKRSYIDVKITIGGQYRNKIANVEQWSLDTAVTDLPTLMQSLPDIRTAVESNPALFLGNIFPYNNSVQSPFVSLDNIASTSRVETTSATLLTPIGEIQYDEYNGHVYDSLALLDDGTLFDTINPCFNEVINFQPVSGFTENSKDFYNLEYTYTKRFKLKAISTSTSKIVTDVHSLANTVNSSINYKSTIRSNKATATVDTVIKEAIYLLNDSGLTSDMFINGQLKVSAFNDMTPNEFSTMVGKLLETGYSKPKTKWWKKAIAVVIVIVAVAIFVLSGGLSGGLSAAMISAALSMSFLIIASMIYAKHISDEWGMKLIGKAIQVNGVALAVMAIMSGYADIQAGLSSLEGLQAGLAVTGEQALDQAAIAIVEDIMVDTAFSIAQSSVGLATSTLGLAGQLGIDTGLDSDVNAALVLAGATINLTSGIRGFTNNMAQAANESLSTTAFRNVTGFVNNLKTGFDGYLSYKKLVNGSDLSEVSKDQGEVESDGVERIYVLQDKTYDNDALSNFDTYLEQTQGLTNTQMLIAKQSL